MRLNIGKGLFYDKENDPMGKQALDILSAKLAASGKFLLLERGDLNALLEEVKKGEGSANTNWCRLFNYRFDYRIW